MRRIYRHYQEVPQGVGDRGVAVVQRCFEAYGVSRAVDLPEEGKVRLLRDLQGFMRVEQPEGVRRYHPSDYGWRLWWKRLAARLRFGQQRQ